MLLTLGLDSQFTMASTFKTEQSDFSMDQTGWDPDHGNVWRVSLASSSPMVGCRWNLFCRISSRPAHVPPGWLLFSLLNIETQGGYFIFVLMDWYSGSWSLIFLAVLEVILVAWVSSITWEWTNHFLWWSSLPNAKYSIPMKHSSLSSRKRCKCTSRCMGSSAYVGTYTTWELKPQGDLLY